MVSNGKDVPTETPQQRTERIFVQMDKNMDGVLTKKEFIDGCLADEVLCSMLTANSTSNGQWAATVLFICMVLYMLWLYASKAFQIGRGFNMCIFSSKSIVIYNTLFLLLHVSLSQIIKMLLKRIQSLIWAARNCCTKRLKIICLFLLSMCDNFLLAKFWEVNLNVTWKEWHL